MNNQCSEREVLSGLWFSQTGGAFGEPLFEGRSSFKWFVSVKGVACKWPAALTLRLGSKEDHPFWHFPE